jgi:hypothetical protein
MEICSNNPDVIRYVRCRNGRFLLDYLYWCASFRKMTSENTGEISKDSHTGGNNSRGACARSQIHAPYLLCVSVCVCVRCSFPIFHTWQLSKELYRIGNLSLFVINSLFIPWSLTHIMSQKWLKILQLLVCTGFLCDNSTVPRNITSTKSYLLYAHHHLHSG